MIDYSLPTGKDSADLEEITDDLKYFSFFIDGIHEVAEV